LRCSDELIGFIAPDIITSDLETKIMEKCFKISGCVGFIKSLGKGAAYSSYRAATRLIST
jgi:hypothetical protein